MTTNIWPHANVYIVNGIAQVPYVRYTTHRTRTHREKSVWLVCLSVFVCLFVCPFWYWWPPDQCTSTITCHNTRHQECNAIIHQSGYKPFAYKDEYFENRKQKLADSRQTTWYTSADCKQRHSNLGPVAGSELLRIASIIGGDVNASLPSAAHCLLSHQ